jgi:hypothetical protein
LLKIKKSPVDNLNLGTDHGKIISGIVKDKAFLLPARPALEDRAI